MTYDWRVDAACRNVDPEVFFPLDETQERLVAPARKVCAYCPVRARCLAWALDALPHGVAGGLTADERRTARRRARAA